MSIETRNYSEFEFSRVCLFDRLLTKREQVRQISDSKVLLVSALPDGTTADIRAVYQREDFLRGINRMVFSVYRDLREMGLTDLARDIVRQHREADET